MNKIILVSLASTCFSFFIATKGIAATKSIATTKSVAEEYATGQVLHSSTIEALALSPWWQKLLHFKNGSSQIRNGSFFLSPEGGNNAFAELVETINAIKKPQGEYPVDLHPQCVYPARVQWLKQELGDSLILPEINCPTYSDWKHMNNAESVSVIFVSGFFGNPASFFGHLMLKMNQPSGKSDADSPLLDMSINYGADVPDGDGPIKYMAYGLLGGYEASYTQEDYYIYDASYAEIEQRVLWEYELNLTAEEVDLLQDHLWEIGQAKFTYYFLSFNCASQLANFINVVVDSPLLNQNQPWDMPIDVFKNIAKTKHHGEGLLRHVKKRDSKYDRLHAKYVDLSYTEKAIAKRLIDNVQFLNSDEYIALNSTSKSKILSTLYDYVELEMSRANEVEIDTYKAVKRKLMLANLELAPAELGKIRQEGLPPHQAQNPILGSIAWVHNLQNGGAMEFRTRIGYYDFLSIEASRFKDSNATFLDARIRTDGNKAWLHSFDFLNIAALNILDVDLFEESRWAWNTRVTVEQADLKTQNDERFRLYSGFGFATRTFGEAAMYAMPSIRVDATQVNDSYVGIDLGLLYTANSLWKSHLKLTPYASSNSEHPTSFKLSWENRFGDSATWDTRVKIEHDKQAEVTLSSNWYF